MSRLAGAWIVFVCGPALFALPPTGRPNFDTGESLQRSGNCQGALQAFESSEAAREEAPRRPLLKGICLAKQGKWVDAEAQLSTYVREHGTEPPAWLWLAQSQLFQKHFEDARQSIGKAALLDPKSAEIVRTLGEIELELKNYDGAYRAWIRAEQLDPADPRTKYYLGRLFFEAEYFNESAAWLKEVLKIAPDHFAAMTYLGLCAERLNMEDTAVNLYRAAIRESKKQKKPYPWAYVNLAKLQRQFGKEQEALAILQEQDALCPEAHGLTVLGQMLAAANQNERAEAVLRRAIDMDSSIPDAHYRLALLLRTTGRAAEAEQELQKFQAAKQAEERSKVKINAIRKQG